VKRLTEAKLTEIWESLLWKNKPDDHFVYMRATADAQLAEDQKEIIAELGKHRGVPANPGHPDPYVYFTFTNREWQALKKGEKNE